MTWLKTHTHTHEYVKVNLYVYESLDLHMWDRIPVPCALRMRSTESCVKTF